MYAIKPKIKFTKQGQILHEENGIQIIPTQAYGSANAYDLYPCILSEVRLMPTEEIRISTGLHIWLDDLREALPETKIKPAGLLMPRSSNPKGLLLTNHIGLLDCDYQGEVFMSWKNVSEENTFTFAPGRAMGQLLIIPSFQCEIEVSSFETDWQETNRKENGFGSSNDGK